MIPFPRVTVVVPTRRFTERLSRCLDALAAQTAPPFEIILVTPPHMCQTPFVRGWTTSRPAFHGRLDGGRYRKVSDTSTPTSKVQMVGCGGVFSFCRAANRGIAAAGGEWILLLNDDVVPAPTFLERLLEGIPPDDRVGMVCGKLLAADGRTIDSTGQFLSRARTASERGNRCRDTGQFDEPGYVFSAPGAAALYRHRMLKALADHSEYFDEALGMYLEDLELGWRAQRAGWRGYYVPAAVARHTRGATAKSRRPRWGWLRRYYFPWLPSKLQARYILNRYQLIAKHDSLMRFLRDSPWILWYELRLWTYLACLERPTVHLLRRLLRKATA